MRYVVGNRLCYVLKDCVIINKIEEQDFANC